MGPLTDCKRHAFNMFQILASGWRAKLLKHFYHLKCFPLAVSERAHRGPPNMLNISNALNSLNILNMFNPGDWKWFKCLECWRTAGGPHILNSLKVFNPRVWTWMKCLKSWRSGDYFKHVIHVQSLGFKLVEIYEMFKIFWFVGAPRWPPHWLPEACIYHVQHN